MVGFDSNSVESLGFATRQLNRRRLRRQVLGMGGANN